VQLHHRCPAVPQHGRLRPARSRLFSLVFSAQFRAPRALGSSPELFERYPTYISRLWAGCGSMSEQGDRQKIAGIFTLDVLARAAGVRTLPKRLLRVVDQFDYLIRHWLIPITFENGVRLLPHREAWIRASGLPNAVQAAIGHGLRAEYGVDRSMPARLAALLNEFERRTNEAARRQRDAHERGEWYRACSMRGIS
jgi:hypothetical protein